MALTTQQRTALRAAIEADQTANTLFVDGNLGGLADYYNAPSSPTVWLWKSSVPTADLFDQIVWANMTPTGSPGADAAWTNRSLACQGKQFNLQTILVGRDTINPSKIRIRDGLQDALTDLPSGNNGNLRQAGWDNVRSQLFRAATRFEALFKTGTGTNVDPGKLGIGLAGSVIEGAVSYAEFIGL